jgi:hypothetical protein
MPPLDGVIELASRHHNPVGRVNASDFFHGRRAPFLPFGQVNVSGEARELDPKAKLIVQVFDKAMKEMDGSSVGELNQRIMAFDDPQRRIVDIQPSQIRIIFPEFRAAGPYIRKKLSRIALMKVAHRRGEHHHIAGRLKVGENQLLHRVKL